MYLSKIILDIRHPSVRQALRDANDMHRNIMAGFSMQSGGQTARADYQVLYRLFSKRDQLYLLVSSKDRPDEAALARRGFYTDDIMIRDISPLREVFQIGMCLRFEILASPCRKIGEDGRNSRRMFLKTREEQAEWLNRKADTGGFQILQLNEIGGRMDIIGRRGSMNIKNSAVLFSGLLRITDADAFWLSYTEGIGPGKSYGLGMMNVSAV